MEFECPRLPGASTIGSQLLDETAPMAGKLNPGNQAMSPNTEGKKGTCHADIVYAVGKKGSVWGNNPETMLKCIMALQQTRAIHAHVDNRRPLTAQAYQHRLHHACTGASASQNTVGHEGTLT